MPQNTSEHFREPLEGLKCQILTEEKLTIHPIIKIWVLTRRKFIQKMGGGGGFDFILISYTHSYHLSLIYEYVLIKQNKFNTFHNSKLIIHNWNSLYANLTFSTWQTKNMQAWFSLFCIIDRGQWTLLNNETNTVAVLSRGHLSTLDFTHSLHHRHNMAEILLIWRKTISRPDEEQRPSYWQTGSRALSRNSVSWSCIILPYMYLFKFPILRVSLYLPAQILSHYKMTLINMKLLIHALEVS